jgi:hypothetical protein
MSYSVSMGGVQYQISPFMLEKVKGYVDRGNPVGGFLRAVICNDLKEAVGSADAENLANLPAFVSYFYNEAPAVCWGSEDMMNAWGNAGGSLGVRALQMGYISLYGLKFKILASFNDSDEGVKESNAYMQANPGAAVIVIRSGVIYLADENDKGEPL